MCFYLDIRKVISSGVIFAFLVNTFGPVPLARADDFRLPAPGVMVHLSPPLDPAMLKGIKVHPDNPFRFDFILDQGDRHPERSEGSQQEQLKTEAAKLIKYFLASLTIPEKDLWVNLSPYEKDRIIPNSFGLTEMGRDLLAEDYILKQITASLIYPEDETGKKFWKRVYEESVKKFGTTNIPVNTFNKVWIVPDKAVVYENAKTGAAYVAEAKLKVMLDQDYLSLNKHGGLPGDMALAVSPSQLPINEALNVKAQVNALGSQIVREIVIPELTKEVNEGRNFSQLRQVYNSIILAAWYKKKIRDSILEQVYGNKNKISGLSFSKNSLGDPEQIYERYIQAFKKGVFNYIKEEPDAITKTTVPRKYFSGGEMFTDLAMTSALEIRQVSDNDKALLSTGSKDLLITADLAAMSPSKSDQAMYSWETKLLKYDEHSYAPVFSVGPFTLLPLYDMENMIKKSKVIGDFEGRISDEIKRVRKLYSDSPHQRYLFVSPVSAVPDKPVDSYSMNTISVMLSNQSQFQKSIVLDLGSGAGLLSLVALSLGASKVYLFESERELAYMARGVLEAQGYKKGKDFEILGSIEDSKEFIRALAARNNGERKIIELANLGAWSFYGTANQDALDIFKNNAVDLLINGGYTRYEETKKGSQWAIMLDIYHDLKVKGFDCTVVEGYTNRVLVAKRLNGTSDAAMTSKFEDWFKGISPLRLDRERALLDTLEGLSNEIKFGSDRHALAMNAYAFNVLEHGGFISKEDLPAQEMRAASPVLEYGVNASPKAKYRQAIDWLLVHEQSFLTKENIRDDQQVTEALLKGINARQKSPDGGSTQLKYGWEIRYWSVFALKMRIVAGAALTGDETNKVLKTVLSNLDPNSPEPYYDVRRESADILKILIDNHRADPLKIQKFIEKKGVVENLLQGMSPASEWGFRMQNAYALKALIAGGLVSKEKAEMVLQDILRYLGTAGGELYGPVFKNPALYSVYNAFADTLDALITGKFVSGKDTKEIVEILLRGFSVLLAGGEPNEAKNEDALNILIADGLISRDDVIRNIEKDKVIETLLRGLSPDFYGSVRKKDADALKVLIDSDLVPRQDRFTGDEIGQVFEQERPSGGFLSYYLRLLAVLKENPQTAYQVFKWNTGQLKELFQIFDSLAQGAMQGDFNRRKLDVKFILEEALIEKSPNSLADPQAYLLSLKSLMKETIKDDSVKINIYTDTPGSVRSAEDFVQALGLEGDQRVSIFHGRKKPYSREISEQRLIQVDFKNVPRMDMGAYGHSFDVILPDSPSQMEPAAMDFGFQMIGAQRLLLNKFLKKAGDQAMAAGRLTSLTLGRLKLKFGEHKASLLTSLGPKDLKLMISRPGEFYVFKNGATKLMPIERPWKTVNTSWPEINTQFELLDKIEEIYNGRSLEERKSPIIILDWGAGDGTAVIGLNKVLNAKGIPHHIYGLSHDYFRQWENADEGITFILDDANNLSKYLLPGSVDLIFSHFGLTHFVDQTAFREHLGDIQEHISDIGNMVKPGGSIRIGSFPVAEEKIISILKKRKFKLVETSSYYTDFQKDTAMSSSLNGGIDLTSSYMNLKTMNKSGGINFHLTPAALQQLQNAQGFVPVIINIQPLKSLPEFLGLTQKLLDTPA